MGKLRLIGESGRNIQNVYGVRWHALTVPTVSNRSTTSNSLFAFIVLLYISCWSTPGESEIRERADHVSPNFHYDAQRSAALDSRERHEHITTSAQTAAFRQSLQFT